MADQKVFSQEELRGMVSTLLDHTRANIRAYEDKLVEMRRSELAKATPQPRPQRAIGVGGGVEELGAGTLTGKAEVMKLEAFADGVGKGEVDLGHENLYLTEEEMQKVMPPSVSQEQMHKLEQKFGKAKASEVAWSYHKKFGRSKSERVELSKSLSKAEVPVKLPPPGPTVGDAEAEAWQDLVQRRGGLTRDQLARHENQDFLAKNIVGVAASPTGVPPAGTHRPSPTGADRSRLVGSAGGTGLNLAEALSKPPVSEAQRGAMAAAAHGNSTLGIPKKVGKEFMDADSGGHLPKTAKAEGHAFEKAGKFSSLCAKCAKREFDDVHKTEVTTAAGFPKSVGDTNKSPTGTDAKVQAPTTRQSNPGDGGGKVIRDIVARARQGRRQPPVKKGELGAAGEMQQGLPGNQTRTLLNQAEPQPCPKCGETHVDPQGQPVDHNTAILFEPMPQVLHPSDRGFKAIRARVKAKKTDSVGMGEPYQAAEPPMAKPPGGPTDRTQAPTSTAKPMTAGPMAAGKAGGGGARGVPPGGALKLPKLPGVGKAEDDEGETCPTCGGQAGLMGTLGNREHYQCRGCGQQYSRETQAPVQDKSIRGIRNRVRSKKGLDKGLMTSVAQGTDPSSSRSTRAPLTADRPQQALPTPAQSERRAHAFQSALGGEFQPRPGQPPVSGLELDRPRPESKFATIRARVKKAY